MQSFRAVFPIVLYFVGGTEFIVQHVITAIEAEGDWPDAVRRVEQIDGVNSRISLQRVLRSLDALAAHDYAPHRVLVYLVPLVDLGAREYEIRIGCPFGQLVHR